MVPPLVALVLAILTQRVLFSLAGATLVAVWIVQGTFWGMIQATALLFIELITQVWVLYTLAFVLLIGAVIRLLEASHAVFALVEAVTVKRKWVTSKRSALTLGMIAGILIFIESTIATLIVATIVRPLAHRYHISKEKIAYLCDTTAAPVCSLLPFNGWGALLIGLLTTAIATHNLVDTTPVQLLIEAIFYNFYAWSALGVLAWSIYKQWDFSTMQKHATPCALYIPPHYTRLRLSDFIMPIVSLLVVLVVALIATGHGTMIQGDAPLSLMISVVVTLVLMYIAYVWFGFMSSMQYLSNALHGIKELVPLTLVLIFAILFSMSLKELGTAHYLGAWVSVAIPAFLIPVSVFVIASIMGFATGTSWGTFAIMIPIGVACIDPTQGALGVVVGAAVSGGVFGDHASPISDTSILASMATGCDHMAHIKSQLPYTLLSAAIAAVLFVFAGLAATL